MPEQWRVVRNHQAGMTEVYIGFDMCEAIVQGVEQWAFVPIVVVGVGMG
jgi:hypothetical protein